MSKYTDSTYFVSFNARVLNYWGMWPIIKGNTNREIFNHWLHTILIYLLMSTLVFGQLCHAYQTGGDVAAISENISLMFTTHSMVCKVVNMTLKRKTFYKLYEFLQCPMFKSRNQTHQSIIDKRIKSIRLTEKSFFYISVFTLIWFLAFPFIEKKGRHPCPVSYPYIDIKVSPYYEIIYASQMVSLSGLAIINSSMDTLIPGFMSQAIAQLECLADSLNTILMKEPTYNEDPNEKLKNIILHHKAILSYISSIEDMFTIPVIFQYFVSGIVICCSGIQIVIINPEEESIKIIALVSYLLTMMSEIFIYCWYGNEIMTKSQLLSQNIYEIEWMMCTPKFKNTMKFFMLRSGKPVIVTLGKMIKLNLASFTAILNTSYSYYALLRHMYKAEGVKEEI